MQVLPVYLYQNNLVVTLDLDPTVIGVNNVMYQRDLNVQKGLKNSIRIQFKNSDQKRITITNTETFVFSMFDAIDQRLLVEKELTVLDEGTTSTRGLALLTLTESDTVDLDRTSYTYSIKKLESDNSYSPAYSNTYYGVNGTLNLLNDVYPVLQPSIVIESMLPSYNATTELYEFKSRAVYADPQFQGNTALHTAAVYMTGFKGTLYVMGTLNNNPNETGYYATLATRHYNNVTGIDYINFNGIYSYVNFMYVPDLGPTDLSNNNNQSYRGTLDKILYRS
jgi:hypothetical protein